MLMVDASQPVHANCAAVNGRAVLILGASGTGKSALTLDLMSCGATLVADDRTILTRTGDAIMASPPAAIAGRIEARGVGILSANFVADCPLHFVVDLDQTEHDRLPQMRVASISGVTLPLIYRAPHGHFGHAILQMLRGDRSEP